MTYQLYNCDFRAETAPKIEVPHSLIIDPPYCSGGIQERQRTSAAGTVGKFSGKEAILNDSLTTDGYERLMRRAFGNAYCSEVYTFLDWKMLIPTQRCLEEAGFLVKSLIVWDKIVPGLGSVWRSQAEYVLWGIRPGLCGRGWGRGNILRHPRPSSKKGKKNHSTEKPVTLMLELCESAKELTIVDLCMGSGSTGVAALRAGREFIGVEMFEPYYLTAQRRLEEEAQSLAK